MLKKIEKIFLDTLFPISCFSCRTDGFWLCEQCLKKISFQPFQVCPFCEKIMTDGGKVCDNCNKEKRFLDRLVVTAKYKDQKLDKIIHLFKYRFIDELANPLGKLLIKSLVYNNCPIPDLIIPVPLHPRRLRWRGFNQSELLAEYIADNLTPGFLIPIAKNILIRKKYTSPQMKIKNFKSRRENIKNAFTIQDSAQILNKNILLVDDIATTGSTLFECARVLKENGAKKVMAAVLARQEIHKKSSS